jgi:MGT family glycosyltransferase
MKILFAAIGAIGHVNPLLAIARMVKARGDDVLFTTARALKERVESAGARFVPLAGEADLDFRNIDKVIDDWATIPPGPPQIRKVMERGIIDLMGPQARSLRGAIAAEAPDIIVADSMFYGIAPLLIDRSRPRPPIVACGVTFLPLDRPDRAPLGLGLPPACDEADRRRYAEIATEVDASLNAPLRAYADARLADIGLPNLSHSFFQSWVLLADAYLQPTVRAFEYDYGPLPPTVHFVGALPPPSGTAPRPGWWSDLDGGRKLVLTTQGTFANLDFDEVVEPTLAALAGRDDLLVIVTTGGRPVEDVRGPIPPNARLARFLDYEALLPRLDLLVTNGGYGTVSLALRAGVPIVSAGLAEDKAEVGARIAWSGVGVHLASKAAGVEAVRGGVEQVLGTPAYRERARAMAASFAAVNTRREIFSILDHLVAQGTGMRGRNDAGVMTA